MRVLLERSDLLHGIVQKASLGRFSASSIVARRAATVSDLKQVWEQAVPLLGLLAAKVVDGGAFEKIWRADLASIGRDGVDNATLMEVCSHRLDKNFTAPSLLSAVYEAADSGLSGQTMQLHFCDQEMSMLYKRFALAGLQPPEDAAVVDQAHNRVVAAYRSSLQLGFLCFLIQECGTVLV
jgi:hypothetical protein